MIHYYIIITAIGMTYTLGVLKTNNTLIRRRYHITIILPRSFERIKIYRV